MTEVRGQIVDGQIQHWQVGLKVGFPARGTAADRAGPHGEHPGA